MNRREFTGTVLTYGLVQMLWARDLFAADVKPVVGQWFKDLNALGNDLKGQKLKDVEFQAKMEELYKKVDLAELVKFVELDRVAEKVKLPANGAFSAGFDLAGVEGLGGVSFGKQIFCLKKDRAVVPHGHANMCTGFIILKGKWHGRHYDKLETLKEHYVIKPTIDREFGPGDLSTISDHKDNVHWFRAVSETAYIFNVHVTGYNPGIKETTGRLYLDPEGEKLSGGLVKAAKMSSAECHKKYG